MKQNLGGKEEQRNHRKGFNRQICKKIAFESFVIKHYENIADAEGKEKIFEVYFEKFKEIISKKEYNYKLRTITYIMK